MRPNHITGIEGNLARRIASGQDNTIRSRLNPYLTLAEHDEHTNLDSETGEVISLRIPGVKYELPSHDFGIRNDTNYGEIAGLGAVNPHTIQPDDLVKDGYISEDKIEKDKQSDGGDPPNTPPQTSVLEFKNQAQQSQKDNRKTVYWLAGISALCGVGSLTAHFTDLFGDFKKAAGLTIDALLTFFLTLTVAGSLTNTSNSEHRYTIH